MGFASTHLSSVYKWGRTIVYHTTSPIFDMELSVTPFLEALLPSMYFIKRHLSRPTDPPFPPGPPGLPIFHNLLGWSAFKQ
jgi:hypothetical protein